MSTYYKWAALNTRQTLHPVHSGCQLREYLLQVGRSLHATDIASGSHSAIGAHPPVDRASTGVLETDDALTEPRRALRTPSEYRASTETGTEETVPVMNTTAGGPTVDRTLTGMLETLALTSTSVAEKPRGGSYRGRIVHPAGRRCYARSQGRDESIGRLTFGDKASRSSHP